ncbi:hypothetical protein M422DRAFT_242859 [Sphaerobolus stellatus SS14]|nr:hypothetical protein M422DRAFT_242859 [Sphaerobolus stellatus SS14]
MSAWLRGLPLQKACYTLKHGEVVDPLISDCKSRTPQPQPIISSTATITSGVQEAPADTTLASDAAHSNSHAESVESSESDLDEDNVRKGIKLRDPDTYDGSNPEKLQNFLFLYSLGFKSKAKAYKSKTSKIYFALSFLWGATLEYFEPVVMADYPNKDDQPPEEDAEIALEELKMEKHHQATWFFISFAKYKAKTTCNDHGYYCLVMNAMPDQILKELHRIYQHYWNHKKIMDLRQKGAPKLPVASNTALSGNNNNNNNKQSGNNKSKDNKLNSNKGKTNNSMSAGASSSKAYDNSHLGADR